MIVVGIDLGTTHTVAAFGAAKSDEIDLVSIPQLVSRGVTESRVLLPSVLYAPLESEALNDPFAPPPFIEGELARLRAAEIPGRAVLSAKSWLSYSGVDRSAPILPWGADADDAALPKISPVDASARYLARVKRSLEEAEIKPDSMVLTVPASFDESARELTLQAAAQVGLDVRLLEEPQAAFYDVMRRIGESGLNDLLERTAGEARVLVCDVGGGTTDLSLLRVSRSPETNELSIERVAVGRHLLLGGDNMDLALATLAESRFGQKLDATRFSQLVVACRNAKEKLLSADAPEKILVRILTAGAKLVGATLSTELTREDAHAMLVEGYFPLISRSALAEKKSPRGGSAIISFGLPYEKEPAITRHVAAFIARHGAAPNVLLLNGGVFHAPLLAARIAEQVAVCSGTSPILLTNDAPDLAVARGAVAYGRALAKRASHEKSNVPIIGGGSARGYYVGVDVAHAICILPRGAEEGTAYVAEGRAFALTIGKPARFELFASADANDAAGQIIELDLDRFIRLPNLTARLGDAGRTRELRVAVRGELTAVGTLDLSCVEIAGENRSFRLSFQLREGDGEPVRNSTKPPPSANSSAVIDAKKMIAAAFETSNERNVKDLLRDLERRLGERNAWSIDLARALFDAFAAYQPSRKRSADHERVFWMLAGYCARPGFGFAGDEDRAHVFARLFAEKVTFTDNPRVWQQFFIAMRRAAGGIDETTQIEMRDAFDPLLAPPEANLKKSKKWKPLSLDDMLETAASLERVPTARRVELGNWLIERTWTDRDPRIWSAIGKLGARVPSYASVHHVVSPQTAEKWLDHLLREKWETLQTAEFSAVRLARVTGDRARDVSEKVRAEVEKRLVKLDARPESIRAVRELVVVNDAERATFFGETLPIGLRLL